MSELGTCTYREQMDDGSVQECVAPAAGVWPYGGPWYAREDQSLCVVHLRDAESWVVMD